MYKQYFQIRVPLIFWGDVVPADSEFGVWMHVEDLNYQKIGEALTGLEWGNKTTKCGNKESRAIIESTYRPISYFWNTQILQNQIMLNICDEQNLRYFEVKMLNHTCIILLSNHMSVISSILKFWFWHNIWPVTKVGFWILCGGIS